ncbi:hypothetical protein SMGD1_0618 [Sulfurimonas gotlandica GD1]|uniref:ATP/GTP-binding protein n=1 Tax=Sulfurimonas gotlandica (strain DSM 19862 / JCM 16533 / GD1) TaxID=929558 RepID=B6BKT5_SULGG|nr:hypothetical protein [Sulfurimonas gotlandica]EDZ62467.1 conserved hypothetical protein [Sulfurimonas gotlandica GD1]EHP29145.1 hypothetical protein SMGD1_0618 [Sulfurimonas gotlandica GD1]
MNTSYAVDSYRAHDLSIAMKTSSGDVIKMDFANHQSASMSHEQNASGSKTTMSFASMQSFQFNIESNGIDAQDKKEIDAFMKIAQPFIDSFLKELQDAAPKSPVTQLANKIASIFEPSKERDENAKNNVKTNIVKMFDDSMKKLEAPEKLDNIDSLDKIFADAQKLLEKTLKAFDDFNKNIYA